jgi:hypothetical protein
VLVALLAPALVLATTRDPVPPVPAPIGWREPAPFARMFLQLPFEAPEVLPTGRLEASLDLLYSNSVMAGRSRNDRGLALDVHVETAQPTVSLRYGLAPRLEVLIAVPFVADEGGFLDWPINQAEALFGAPNQDRVGRPRGRSWFELHDPAGRGVDVRGTDGGIGDVWASAKVLVADGLGGGGSVAVRAAVKLPTGRIPYGSGEVDVGGGVLAAWGWPAVALRVALDVAVPTASLGGGLAATQPYGAATLGVTWRVGGRVALHAQWSGHGSPLTGTGLYSLDHPTSYVLLGTSVRVARGLTLQVGAVENVFSPKRGADVTFPLTLIGRF